MENPDSRKYVAFLIFVQRTEFSVYMITLWPKYYNGVTVCSKWLSHYNKTAKSEILEFMTADIDDLLFQRFWHSLQTFRPIARIKQIARK